MKTAAILMLAGLSAASGQASKENLEFPIVLQMRDGTCAYIIQDMVMRDPRDVSSFLISLPRKDRRVEVLITSRLSSACVTIVKPVITNAGFNNVIVRSGSEDEYSDPLRAAARNGS